MLFLRLILLFYLLVICDRIVGQKTTLTNNSSQSHTIQSLNSVADESNLLYDEVNKKLYFVRRFHLENEGGKDDPGDIWFTKKLDDGSWSIPYKLQSPINDKEENLLFGISNFGTVFWLFGRYDDESIIKQKSHLFRYRLGSNYFERQKIKYYHNISETPTFFVNQDGNIMILSINTFDTIGLEDLYVSFLEPLGSKYNWTKPKNLGNIINTKYQESTPFLSNDNMSLFFSSNGHKGLGSKDIFLSQRISVDWSKWSSPHNLKENINTKGAEEYFIFPEKGVGYFTSTFNSYGYGDIKTVKWLQTNNSSIDKEKIESVNDNAQNTDIIENNKATSTQNPINDNTSNPAKESVNLAQKKTSILKGEVYEKNTHLTLQASITLTPIIEKGREINISTVKIKTNEKGQYQLNLPPILNNSSAMKFEIYVKSKDYFPQRRLIDYQRKSKILNFQLEKLEKNVTIQLDHVLFVAGTSKLLEESLHQLKLIIDAMNENKNMKIELRGHTDGAISASNQILSQKRVNAVKKILVKNSIKSSRIKGIGFGSNQPLYNNKDQENRKKNRRVEFKVLEF